MLNAVVWVIEYAWYHESLVAGPTDAAATTGWVVLTANHLRVMRLLHISWCTRIGRDLLEGERYQTK